MAAEITGDVLEVENAVYSHTYGTDPVRSHVLDIDASNPAATIVGDLCDPETLPAAAFDCILLTQTLQYMRDPAAALTNLWSSLRPGGTLLLTVPCVARVDVELAGSDRWRWTPEGLGVLIANAQPDALTKIEAGGNLVAAIASLMGLAAEDLRASDLAEDDPSFPVTACASLSKPEHASSEASGPPF